MGWLFISRFYCAASVLLLLLRFALFLSRSVDLNSVRMALFVFNENWKTAEYISNGRLVYFSMAPTSRTHISTVLHITNSSKFTFYGIKFKSIFVSRVDFPFRRYWLSLHEIYIVQTPSLYSQFSFLFNRIANIDWHWLFSSTNLCSFRLFSF